MVAGTLILLALAWGCFAYAKTIWTSRQVWVFLAVKIAAGLIATAYYIHVEKGGDILFYHQQASRYLADIHAGSPFWELLSQQADPSAHSTPQARSFFFIKVLTVVYIMLGNHLWLANILFSLVGFGAVVYLIKRIAVVHPHAQPPLVLALLLWPSVAIWGGGLSKEALLLTAMCLLIGSAVPLMLRQWSQWIFHGFLLLLALWLLASVRMFVLLAISPFLLGYLLLRLMERHITKPAMRWTAGLSGAVFIALVVVLISSFDVSLRPGYVLKAFADNHAAVVASSASQHLVMGLGQLWEWPALGLQFLLAMLAGTLGPFLWEINSVWEALLVVEPFVLLVLFFTNGSLSVRFPVKIWLPLLLYVLLTAGFITLSSPNYGSLSRYRLAFYPALVFLAAYRHPMLSKIRF